MGQVQAGTVHPVHKEPAFQQRYVEGRSVESAQHVKLFQSGRDVPEQVRFLRIVPHEELMDLKALIRQPSQAHEKSDRAAAAQAGGLRIQIENPPGIEIRRHLLFAHQGKGVPGQFPGAGKLLRRPVYRKVPAVTGSLFRLCRPARSRPADRPKLVSQVHSVSSFSRRIAVRLPSSPISPTGPTQEGQP